MTSPLYDRSCGVLPVDDSGRTTSSPSTSSSASSKVRTAHFGPGPSSLNSIVECDLGRKAKLRRCIGTTGAARRHRVYETTGLRMCVHVRGLARSSMLVRCLGTGLMLTVTGCCPADLTVTGLGSIFLVTTAPPRALRLRRDVSEGSKVL